MRKLQQPGAEGGHLTLSLSLQGGGAFTEAESCWGARAGEILTSLSLQLEGGAANITAGKG